MEELKGFCKYAIEQKRCLGCTGLAEDDWQEPESCIWADKKKTAEESITKIKDNLGIQMEFERRQNENIKFV